MITLVEGDIEFTFDEDHWWIFYGDEHPDFKKIKKGISGTKSVDFLGHYTDQDQAPTAILLEVKDFRQCSLSDYKNTLENCYEGIPQKVRDSLACVLNGSRDSTHDQVKWQEWIKTFQKADALVLVWREHATHFLHSTNPRHKHGLSHHERTFENKLRTALKWLRAKIFFLDKARYEANPFFQGFSIRFVQ